MNAQEIFETINDNYSTTNYFGLRALTQDPVTGEFESVQVGERVNNSFNWDDGGATDEMLNGASAIKINEADIDEIEQAIREMKPYLYNTKQVVLLGSESRDFGQDHHEIIMKNSTVLAVWNV